MTFWRDLEYGEDLLAVSKLGSMLMELERGMWLRDTVSQYLSYRRQDFSTFTPDVSQRLRSIFFAFFVYLCILTAKLRLSNARVHSSRLIMLGAFGTLTPEFEYFPTSNKLHSEV